MDTRNVKIGIDGITISGTPDEIMETIQAMLRITDKAGVSTLQKAILAILRAIQGTMPAKA